MCEHLRKLLELNSTLKTFFEWFLNSDGTISSEFKMLLQDIATPTGAILWRPLESVPTGYLVANGQAVNRTTYANLFAIYGTTFGAGDSSTTFNLPNLQSKFLMGAGAAGSGVFPVGSTGGAEQVTLDITNIPAHAHGMPTDSLAIRTTLTANAVGTADNAGAGGGGFVGRATFLSEGGDQPHNNLPPYMAGLWLIKT